MKDYLGESAKEILKELEKYKEKSKNLRKGQTIVMHDKVWRLVGDVKDIIETNPFKNCLNSCLVSGGKDCIAKCVVEALDSGMTVGDILNVVDHLISADFPIDSLVVLSEVMRYELNARAKPIDVTKEYHGEV